jgi:DNA-binding NarL/FixJ family response regulator
MLRGLHCLLDSQFPFTIVASCSTGADCINILREIQPDIALVDISLPGLKGLEILNTVRAEELSSRIVYLAASITDCELTEAAIRGAHGVLFKDYSSDALLHGLREVAGGRKCLPATLIDGAVQRETEQKNRFLGFRALTGREREVMLFAAAGLPNKQIARHLNLCEGTVKLHLHKVYCKMGVRNRSSLAAFVRSRRDVLQELSAFGVNSYICSNILEPDCGRGVHNECIVEGLALVKGEKETFINSGAV